MKRFYTFLTLLVLCAATARAQVTVQPTPSWVTVNSIPYDKQSMNDAADDGYIDVGFERQISVGMQTSYVRYVKRVLTEAGVENAAEVSFDYDPSYQRASLHSLQIRRGATVIDRTRSVRFALMQQESERSKHIYNGRLTAVHNLEDLRVGDVIEYSYSIRGFNPVFDGKFSNTFDTRFTIPVYHLYYKLLLPAGRSLKVLQGKEPVAARQSVQGGDNIYEWRLQDCKPMEVEQDLPGWYDPYPFIQVSEYASWKEVNDWAIKLFPANIPPAVKAKANELAARFPKGDDAAVAAIRFVQDEVRYLGIEMGANTHQPHAPSEVLAQRFGDCKDKSYLLVTLLRALGHEAWPVLTPSDTKRGAGRRAGCLPLMHSITARFRRASVPVRSGSTRP